MPLPDAWGLVERRFRVVVLDVPHLLAGTRGEAARAIWERIDALLARQVRVVICPAGEAQALADEACRRVAGLEKVFLFVWTDEGRLWGFDQAGRLVALGEAEDVAPGTAAWFIVDAVAEPAEIPLEEVLVVAESYAEDRPAHGFARPPLGEARCIQIGPAEPLPEGVVTVPAGSESLQTLLGGLVWQIG
jgi:hypothetical protein